MNPALNWLGSRLARYLASEIRTESTAPAIPAACLLATLLPGDVILVEGHSRVSVAIRYLTQSTWSHAALFVGPVPGASPGGPEHCIIEADTVDGVRSVGIDAFERFHCRICRPVGLTRQERQKLVDFAIARIGQQYDLRNVFDLARYLMPTPLVPERFRRSMLALGSGDPTRAICSTLIAQAFQSVHYPILPISNSRDGSHPGCPSCVEDTYRMRHHSLFVPRDFDVSPYFEVVKPTLAAGFDFHTLKWSEDEAKIRA